MTHEMEHIDQASCGCEMFRSGSDEISFRYCGTHTAAPALLAALEAFLTEHDSHPEPEEGAAVAVCPGCWEAETQARAAILAAKGEAND